MKPISNVSVIITVILCITMGFLSLAQEGPPASFVVEDLQLISLASKPEWDNDWEYSRAVEAATILAWFHDHGYALLLGDLNEDGVIDELDTIELADRLGKHSMGCEEPRRPTDAWLVFGLAEYVAEKYPDIFELKIYDRGFPSEFERKMGSPFAPDAIPGIILTLESEPTFASYMKELVEEEGVILGLEEEPGRNLYFTGRSFLRDPIAPNIHGIDLVWAEEDWYTSGTQGKVLETRARQTDAFYVDYRGEWMKVESMFALSSVYPCLSVVSSAAWDCTTSPEGGSGCTITVQAEVTNTGNTPIESDFEVILVVGELDEPTLTIAKTVHPHQINPTGNTTVDFAFLFSPPSPESSPCTYSLLLSRFWYGNLGWAVANTVAVPQVVPGDDSGNGFFYGEGCCEGIQDCLDIVITADTATCYCEDVLSETWRPDPTYPQGGWWETAVVGESCEVEVRYMVKNIGTQDAGEFHVRMESSTGDTDTSYFSGLLVGEEKNRWFDFTTDAPGEVTVTLIADNDEEVDECDEDNNTASTSLGCH